MLTQMLTSAATRRDGIDEAGRNRQDQNEAMALKLVSICCSTRALSRSSLAALAAHLKLCLQSAYHFHRNRVG